MSRDMYTERRITYEYGVNNVAQYTAVDTPFEYMQTYVETRTEGRVTVTKKEERTVHFSEWEDK